MTDTIGIIYPDHAAESDYPLAAEWLGVHLPVTHIYGTDLHAVAELLDLGSPDRLARGAQQLAGHDPDAVLWACTSGSFVYGYDGADQQADELARVAGVPAASTSQAYLRALHSLGLSRVAVAASYPDDVAGLFIDYLGAGGIEVVSWSSAEISTAAEVGTLQGADVLSLAERNDHPDAEVLLIPDTAMRTLEVVTEIESRIGKPVLTANQVTVWEGLRLVGGLRPHERLGALFAEGRHAGQ